MLVLAGAGSGKTRVLTYKVAWLIENLRIKPWEILAVTFTNKAANEMHSRIESLIGKAATKVWISTFHSFCARVLRKYAEILGYSRDFTIYDAYDSKSLIKRIINDHSINLQISPKAIAGKISKAKNRLISPEDYSESDDFRAPLIKTVYELYQETLKTNNAMDFDDLLVNAYEVLNRSNEALLRFSFKYILVDEYQDTNHIQYELLKLLSTKHNNLTVVGDEDQSIYGFRGADIGHILRFEKDFPDAKLIRLEENYRSTGLILQAASQVVSHNNYRIGKELWTNNPDGEPLSLFTAPDASREAYELVNTIKGLSHPLNDFVILYRTNAQSRVIEEAFRLSNIPYTIVGGIRFYERKEIKDALAYLRVLINPQDSVAFNRIINTPHRGIGPGTLQILSQFAEKQDTSVYFALKEVDKIESISTRRKKTLKKFFKLMESHRKKIGKPDKLIDTILHEIGYWDKLEEEDTLETQSRIENLQELIRGASDYSSLDEFLETVSLFTNIDKWDDTQSYITLMTVHNAKGLEFPIVFITGLEEGLFPHSLSLNNEVELEEERRLFYVALTRAKEKVYLSYALDRKGYGYSLKSRFLDEIPPELIEESSIYSNL